MNDDDDDEPLDNGRKLLIWCLISVAVAVVLLLVLWVFR
jgi:hypothetical protein